MLAEYDRESNTRQFTGLRKNLMRYALAAFSLYVLWMNVFSTLPEQIRRASFVGLVIFLAFFLYPLRMFLIGLSWKLWGLVPYG